MNIFPRFQTCVYFVYLKKSKVMNSNVLTGRRIVGFRGNLSREIDGRMISGVKQIQGNAYLGEG